jgi:hypothetical protein
MTNPTFTIRVSFDLVFGRWAWAPIPDLQKACDTFNVKMAILEERFFEFTADDPRNFFLLGLNFPK